MVDGYERTDIRERERERQRERRRIDGIFLQEESLKKESKPVGREKVGGRD